MLAAVAAALPRDDDTPPPSGSSAPPLASKPLRGLDTRLHDVCYSGQLATMEHLLLELGGGASLLDRRDRAGDTPLHLACLGGHTRLAARLLQECPRLVDAQDNQGWTAMHYAGSTGNSGVVEQLFDAGARIFQDKDGNTPAHEAASKGHAACGQLIVERAAAKAATGRGAGRDDGLKLVTQAPNTAGETALMLAAARGIPPMCVALIDHGAEMDQRNHSGWAALHHAANAGRPAVIALLGQRGCNINAHDKAGETAMHKACTKDSHYCVRNLCDGGCDPRLLSADGRTALHCCVQNKNVGCARHLLEAAATTGVVRYIVVARDRRGRTALDLSVRLANKPIAIMLKETVAAMIVQDSFRRYLAIQHAKLEAAALKIQRVYRGKLARDFYKQHKHARNIRLNHAARVIQRRYRHWVATRKKQDTFGMAARYQTEFAVDVVEREAKAHTSAAAKHDRELARERRVVEREERQQEAVRAEAAALMAADEEAKEAAQAELLALEEAAKADEAEALEDGEEGSDDDALEIEDRPGGKKLGLGEVVEEAEEDAGIEQAPPPDYRKPRGPDWESMGGAEGVIGGPLPPTIDVGAALEALVALEKSTVARFDQLTQAVGNMTMRVSNLEERLLDEMKHDAIHLAQAQDSRAEEGFMSNLRSMAGAVGQLRTEQRHAEAAQHAKKLMGTDEAGLKEDQVKANWAALRGGTAQAGILKGGFGADFVPSTPLADDSGGRGRSGSGSDGSGPDGLPLAGDGTGGDITSAGLAAMAMEATREPQSKTCSLQ